MAQTATSPPLRMATPMPTFMRIPNLDDPRLVAAVLIVGQLFTLSTCA
jgi:hypothetical protein